MPHPYVQTIFVPNIFATDEENDRRFEEHIKRAGPYAPLMQSMLEWRQLIREVERAGPHDLPELEAKITELRARADERQRTFENRSFWRRLKDAYF